MAPRVSVVIGKNDFYDPQTKIVHLAQETLSIRNQFAIFRACHEAGHAVQHRINSLRWRMRNDWLPVLDGLFVAAMGMAALFWSISLAMTAIGVGLGLAIWFGRALIILAAEREASEIALDWLEENFAPEETDMRAGRAYLDKLRKSYWRVLIGR